MSGPRAVGIDVGGTRIKAVLMTGSGDVLEATVRPTPARPGPELGTIAGELRAELEAATGHSADALAVVVPGLFEDRAGIARWSANLGWRDLALTELLAGSLDIPVASGHDVRAGLLAEHRFGAAREVDDVLFLPLGTGIASAHMTGGVVTAGSPWTGEVGHVVIRPDGRECGCGARGCLEAEASAAALGRIWSEVEGEPRDAEDLAVAVRAGDDRAKGVWSEAVDALALVLSPAVAAAGTRLVLLGGGLALAGDLLADPLHRALSARLPGRSELSVRVAELGDRAGALGAACLALDLLTEVES
ncbi:ROK family protein [Marihabitans asiaticum]|uniref:Glucokinase n=1 Tax=Marihabitans asiaticum TaxID=415218 RepID=A0A560WH63_9MICO|nr:ROK family protein [Marihabitans asiaticum]TWD16900.1 glucokinase [Marihabitans asiaticum]